MTSLEGSPRTAALFRAGLLLTMLGLLAYWGDRQLERRLIENRRIYAFGELVPYGKALGVALNRRLNKLEALHGYALKGLSPDGHLDEDDFQSFAEALVYSVDGIRRLSIAPGGIQRFVYPREVNQGEIGRNLFESPGEDLERDILRTVYTRAPVLSPLPTAADETGWLTAQKAVYRGEEFLGLVTLQFETGSLFREGGIIPSPPDVTIGVRDESRTSILGGAEVELSEPVAYRVEFSDSSWELLSAPAEGWEASIRPFVTAYRIAAACFATLLAVIAYLISYRHQQLSLEIGRRTREISEANTSLREAVRQHEEAEGALRKSEERLRRVETFSLIMVAHISLEGCWARVPPTFCELLGYSEAELIGHHVREVTHPDDIAIDLEQFNALMSGEVKTSDLEKRFIRKDGRVVWAYANRSVVADEAGNPLYFLAYLRDITSEEAARVAIQESEERYRRIFESSTDGLYVYTHTGRIIEANPAACDLHRLSWEALMQRTAEDLTHPDSRAELNRIGREVAAGREAAGEVQGLRGDGSVFPLEMSAVPYDFKGRQLGLCIVRDISDRKRVEAERVRLLAEREDALDRLQMTLDRMPAGCVVTDAGGKVVYWNPEAERIFGFESTEVLQREPDTFLSDESFLQPSPFDIEKIRSADFDGNLTSRNLRRDGSTILCQWRATPVFESDATFIGVIAMCQDITEAEKNATALRESEERYRSLVNVMTSVVWTNDPGGRFIVPQPSWEAYTGQKFVDYENYGWVEMIYPDDRERMQACWEEAVRTREPYRAEARLWHAASGFHRFTAARAVPVMLEDGSIREWVGTINDIHDQKLAEEALRESQELYRQIVETAEEGIWLTDENWNLAFVNARLSELLGYEARELIGMNVREFIFANDEESFNERQRSREAGERDSYQANLRRKDGSELCALVSAGPLRSEDGEFLGSLAMVTDITDRVRAQRTLRESERRLATLMKNLPGMAYRCRVDAHWTMEFVSEGCEALTGYPASRLIDNPDLTFVSLIHPDDLHYMSSNVALALKNHEMFRLTYRIRTADGAEKWVWEQGQGIYSMEGGVVALEGFISDITEQKEAENEVKRLNEDLEARVIRRTGELQQANRELESFSYSVSHDLRAPLRGIDGFTRILEEEFANLLPDDGRRYLKLVRGNAQKMGHLIDDLLNFSRMNRQAIRRMPVKPLDLAREAIATLSEETDGRRVLIEYGELPEAEGDPALLRQVYINLLSNALKFSRQREEARIEIASHIDAEWGTVYSVSDNGVGFDMKYKDKLFGVFQRLHRSEDYEGTGVGLALIQRIIHRHGGEIWVEAEPDRGATFYFTLGEGETDE